MKNITFNTGVIKAAALLVGTTISGATYSQVAGDLDTDFGISGYITTDHVAGIGEIIQNSITLSDDKIAMIGYSVDANQDILVARYKADGTVDSTFGNAGVVLIDASIGANDQGYGITELSDGKLLVSGITVGQTSWDAVIFRLNTDGSIDNSFGTGGKTLFNAGANTIALCNELYVNPDNSFYAGATVQSVNGDTDFALFKFTQGGALDNSFGSNGSFVYDYNNEDQLLNSMFVNSNGNVLLGGNTDDGNSNRGLLVRTTSFGTLDSGFGTNGKFVYDDMAADHYINDAIQTSYGKIVAVGSQGSGSNMDGFIIQLNLDGSFDNTFSSDGKQYSDVGAANGVYLWKVLEINGNVLTTGNVSGASMKDIYAYMLSPNGSGVSAFSNGDTYITPAISLNTINMRCASLQSDGKLIVAGDVTSQDFTGNNTFAVRILTEDPLSINEQESAEVIAFPNPIVKTFGIQANSQVEAVSLMDAQGRMVQTWNPSDTYTVSPELTNGIYYLQLMTTNGLTILTVQIAE